MSDWSKQSTADSSRTIAVPEKSLIQLESAVRTLLDVIVELRSATSNIERQASVDIDLIKEFYLETSPVLDELTTALSKRNWQVVRTAAHRIVGDAALCGFDDIATTARAIESAARNESSKAEVHFSELILQLEELVSCDSSLKLHSDTKHPMASIHQGEDGYEELIVDFVNKLSQQLCFLESAAAEARWQELALSANQLAGDASLCGFPLCRDKLKDVEEKARVATAEKVHEGLAVLREMHDSMTRALK